MILNFEFLISFIFFLILISFIYELKIAEREFMKYLVENVRLYEDEDFDNVFFSFLKFLKIIIIWNDVTEMNNLVVKLIFFLMKI